MKQAAKIVAYAAVGWCIAIFIFGLVSFPDAPYKPCNSSEGYCGKGGRSHTLAEYELQHTWEKVLFASWPFGMLAAYFLCRKKKASQTIEPTR